MQDMDGYTMTRSDRKGLASLRLSFCHIILLWLSFFGTIVAKTYENAKMQ